MREQHLDDELIQRALHDELAGATAAEVSDHLHACSDCRARVGEARREEAFVFRRFRSLDHARPLPNAEAVIPSGRRSGAWPAIARLAAAIVLAVGMAAVAYAAPGSPLPALLDRLARAFTRPAAGEPRAEMPTDPRAPHRDDTQPFQGVAVDPGDRFTIVVSGETAHGTAVVSLVDGTAVVVRARAGVATFTSEVDRLVVDTHGPAPTLEIDIPRAAHDVAIVVAGREIYHRVGTHTAAPSVADSAGIVRLPLPSSRSPRADR